MQSKATHEELEKIKDQWYAYAVGYGDEGVYYAEDIKARIEHLQKTIQDNKNAYVYLLKDKNKNDVLAMMEVIHALPNSDNAWIKMLNLDLHPDYIFMDKADNENILKSIDVLFQAILGFMEMIFDDGDFKDAKEAKIFARTEEMGELFKLIAKDPDINEYLSKEKNIECLTEGRKWLKFRKK